MYRATEKMYETDTDMHTVIEKGRKHAKTYETDGNVSSDRRNA
jgi:hypothetical protein